jgi:hypothetical protein
MVRRWRRLRWAGALLALPDVVSARIFVPKGTRTARPAANTFGRLGEFTVHTAHGGASARLDEVSRWFESRLRVLPLTPTMRELRALDPVPYSS